MDYFSFRGKILHAAGAELCALKSKTHQKPDFCTGTCGENAQENKLHNVISWVPRSNLRPGRCLNGQALPGKFPVCTTVNYNRQPGLHHMESLIQRTGGWRMKRSGGCCAFSQLDLTENSRVLLRSKDALERISGIWKSLGWCNLHYSLRIEAAFCIGEWHVLVKGEIWGLQWRVQLVWYRA